MENKFKVSISREGYPDKETAKKCLSSKTAREIGRKKMAFKEQEVTVQEFLGFATEGHSFCNLFQFDENRKYWVESGRFWSKCYPVYRVGLNKGYFKLNFKSDKYFRGSQTIFVDIDYTQYDSLGAYIDTLTYKPTCAYLSYSDNVLKGGCISRRFRLVYVFDKVLDREWFFNCSLAIYSQIEKDTKETISDFCGMSPCQYMNGSNKDETYHSDIIYSADQFKTVTPVVKEEIKEESKDIEKKSKKKKISFSKELVYDMDNLPYIKVVEKWFAKGLRYFTHTDIQFDGFYSTDTDNYYSLFWNKDIVKDGNRRRIKLFLRAAARRLMKENVTADELLYNLYIDRERFFDNTDDVLNIETLQNKVKAALDMDLEDIKKLTPKKNKQFVINPELKNKKQLIGKARRDIKDRQIGEIYDFSISVKENLKILNENGVKVGLRRLYEWVGEQKESKGEKKEIKYNPNLSIRANMVINNCTKYQIEKAMKEYKAKSKKNEVILNEKTDKIVKNTIMSIEDKKKIDEFLNGDWYKIYQEWKEDWIYADLE